MIVRNHKRVAAITLPENPKGRWLKRNKQQVVNAVLQGFISLKEACLRYQLSVAEFLDWSALRQSRRES